MGVLHPGVTPWIVPKPTKVNPAAMSFNNWTRPPCGRGCLPDEHPLFYEDMVSDQGDLLYFPGYWWHDVTSIGPNKYNIGCGIRPKKATMKRLLAYLLFPSFISNDFGHAGNFF